jgi:SAM-dependent methyltransferase
MTEAPFLRATRDSYDAIAADHADIVSSRPAAQPLDRALFAVFAEWVRAAGNGPVADVGCGRGRVTVVLQDLGLDAFGVDLSPEMVAGVKAGATAGAVLAAMITLTFLAVNNLFLDIVSRQHDKRVAFAASGWTSKRAYLTVNQLQGALFLIPALAFVGAVLGLLGATIFRRPASRPVG